MNCKSQLTHQHLLSALALGAMSVISPAHAFSPLSTDDTGTQGRGHNQLELGYMFERNTGLITTDRNDRIETSGITSALPLTYTRGLSNKIDLSFGIARQLTPVKGWQNSELGVKWNFYGDQSQGWSAAIKPILVLPVSKGMQTDGLGQAKTNWGVALIGSYMEESYEFHANLGYNSNFQADVPDWENERKHLWTLSVAPVWNINDQWKVGLDLGLQTNPGYDTGTQAFTQLGVSYAALENLQFGFGIGATRALGSDNKDKGLTLATTVSYQF